MADQSMTEPSGFKKNLNFLLDYFLHSENKNKARWLFAGTIVCILGLTGMGILLGWWCLPSIYEAFIAKDLTLFFIGVASTLLIATAMAGLRYLGGYLKNILHVEWRSWLSKKIVIQYLKNANYLEISRIYKDEIDNPEQRIQEDINEVAKQSLNLTLEFIENFANLTIYTTLIGLAGSSLSFALFGVPIVIPGYLILVALGLGGITSLIGYFITKPLQQLSIEETIAQSSYRADLTLLKNASEEIAIEHAENYYQNRLEKEIDELSIKTGKKASVDNKVYTFNMFISIIHIITPLIALIPLHFNNLISQEVCFNCSFYFSMVTQSLNWFINSFDLINKFKTSLGRVMELNDVLNKHPAGNPKHKIQRTINPANKNLEINGLTLHLHDKNELVIKGLNLKFTPGVHTVIQAPSGAGKSSLFKAIAGTWLSGEGEIILPSSLETIYFLPQKPTIPDDTLRNALAYPDSHCPYSDEQLITALTDVNLKELVDKLDKKVDFKSQGQQQRIAFARVLLRKPKWVFLDEATASLDEPIEEAVYQRIKRLEGTTVISIAHRSTVKAYHHKICFFKVNSQKEVQIDTLDHSVSPTIH